ncbi:MAG: efflux RND transporter periplasmic adaptor subunit [Pseudomonadota bacterium]
MLGPLRAGALLSVAVVLLSACDNDQPEPQPRVRAIAPFTVGDLAGEVSRTLPGQYQAVDSATLSFSVSGTINELPVVVGQLVLEGEVLSRLDPTSYQLDVAAAQADVQRARARQEEADTEFARQRELFQGGWISQAALDGYQTRAETATSDVEAALAQLALAQRNLEETVLTAPYDGSIADVIADNFTVVSAGQSVVQMDAAGAIQLNMAVPDRLASRMALNMEVSLDAATIDDCGCVGRIAEIGQTLNVADTVTVNVAVIDPPVDLLPGMSGSATFRFHDGPDGYYVPFGAVAAGDRPGTSFVFRYDAQAGVVRQVQVTTAGGQGENVLVTEGISQGDVIAAAGTGLLRDGQSVRLPPDASSSDDAS